MVNQPLNLKNHGNYYAYNKGCRCSVCLSFRSEKSKEKRTKIQEQKQSTGIPTDVHGTITGYVSWKCKCEKCKLAKSYYSIKSDSRSDFIFLPDFRRVASVLLAKELNTHPDIVSEAIDKAVKLYRKEKRKPHD